MNKSLPTKLCWRLLMYRDKAWCKVLRDNYDFDAEGPVILKKKQRSSNIWRGIIWSTNLLQSCLCWKVGNGRRTWLWIDK